MTIIRRKVTGNYSVIANDACNDKRLAGEHLGVMYFLLTKPNDWNIRVRALAKRMNWGRDKAYRLISELADFGYIERRQERDRLTGTYKPVEYIVYDLPVGSPRPEKQEPVMDPAPPLPPPANQKAAKIISTDTDQLLPPAPQATFVDNAASEHPKEDYFRPSRRVVIVPSPGSGKSRRTRPWQDRGRYELEIIRRLNPGGADILSALPDSRVDSLCRQQMRGTLDNTAIDELRAEYLKSRSAVSKLPQANGEST